MGSLPPHEGPPLEAEPAELELSLDAASDDPEELDRLARSLRAELLELDVDAVEPVADVAPDGSRAVDALVVGALVVRLVRNAAALGAVVRTVRGWLGPHGDRRVRLEIDGDVIELTGASDDQRERLVNAWIERHARA
jgi:hypothetical protein